MMSNKEEFPTEVEWPFKEKREKRKKTVDKYAAQYPEDFTTRMTFDGQWNLKHALFCRFCDREVGARTDRISEHLSSQSHAYCKSEALKNKKLEEYISTAQIPESQVYGEYPQQKVPVLRYPPPTSTYPMPMHLASLSVSDERRTESVTVTGSGTDTATESDTSTTLSAPVSEDNSPLTQVHCIRRPSLDSAMISNFSKYQKLDQFTDVTLWCENQTIKCHRTVLSAGSAYLENILCLETDPPNAYPVIFLTDLKFSELRVLVDFMYHGKCTFPKGQLQNVLKAAESLEIRGFLAPQDDTNGTDKISEFKPPTGFLKNVAGMDTSRSQCNSTKYNNGHAKKEKYKDHSILNLLTAPISSGKNFGNSENDYKFKNPLFGNEAIAHEGKEIGNLGQIATFGKCLPNGGFYGFEGNFAQHQEAGSSNFCLEGSKNNFGKMTSKRKNKTPQRYPLELEEGLTGMECVDISSEHGDED